MPAAIGTLILTAVGAGGFATTAVIGEATVASIVGTVALTGASIGLQLALAPKPPEPGEQKGQLTTRQPVPVRRRYYGRVKIGGALMFSETLDNTRYQVLALNHGEVADYEQHWLNEIVAVVVANQVTNAFLQSGFPLVGIIWEYGTESDLGFGFLQAQFPGKWDAAHRGLGIAKVLITTGQPADQENFTAVYPGGLPPPYRAVVASTKCWDFRNPGQDRNNKLTWQFSENPVLQILDFHRHADGMGLAPQDAVYFPDPKLATAGIHFAKVLDALGISGELTGRLRPFPNGAAAMQALARSPDARPIGCTQVTEIRNTPGVALAGPLPKEFELATVYTAGVCARATLPEQAKHLAGLLSGEAARGAREQAGFELIA